MFFNPGTQFILNSRREIEFQYGGHLKTQRSFIWSGNCDSLIGFADRLYPLKWAVIWKVYYGYKFSQISC